MQEKSGFFEETHEAAEKYIKDRMLLLKLKMAEKTANLTALLAGGLIIGILSFFILLFLSIMAGYYFSQLTGSLFYGFGIVALIYILFLVILILFRKQILHGLVANTVIRIFFDKQNDEDDDDNTGTSEQP